MFDALIATLPGLCNVFILLCLLFFIYAVIGMQLFAKIAYNGVYEEHASFRNFGLIILTLLRFSTGENWNGYMYDVAHAGSDDCEPDPEYEENTCGFNDDIGTHCFRL